MMLGLEKFGGGVCLEVGVSVQEELSYSGMESEDVVRNGDFPQTTLWMIWAGARASLVCYHLQLPLAPSSRGHRGSMREAAVLVCLLYIPSSPWPPSCPSPYPVSGERLRFSPRDDCGVTDWGPPSTPTEEESVYLMPTASCSGCNR